MACPSMPALRNCHAQSVCTFNFWLIQSTGCKLSSTLLLVHTATSAFVKSLLQAFKIKLFSSQSASKIPAYETNVRLLNHKKHHISKFQLWSKLNKITQTGVYQITSWHNWHHSAAYSYKLASVRTNSVTHITVLTHCDKWLNIHSSYTEYIVSITSVTHILAYLHYIYKQLWTDWNQNIFIVHADKQTKYAFLPDVTHLDVTHLDENCKQLSFTEYNESSSTRK